MYKNLLIFLLSGLALGFSAKFATAQNGPTFSYAPGQLTLDYHIFIDSSNHGLELGFLATTRAENELLEYKRFYDYGVEFIYHYKLARWDNSNLSLGLGARAGGQGYGEYISAVSVPATYNWYFSNAPVGVRFRLTGLFGNYLDVIPSLGISYLF